MIFWDINNLYEQIISANIPNLKFEYFKDKIIIVSNDVEDLVYFLSYLESLGIDHFFRYEAEILNHYNINNMQFYKLILEEYD